MHCLRVVCAYLLWLCAHATRLCADALPARGLQVYGYALIKNGKCVKLEYPMEGYSDDVAGRSFHHGARQGNFCSWLHSDEGFGGLYLLGARISPHTHTHTCKHSCPHECMHTHAQFSTRLHTHVHTCTHTSVHTCTHTLRMHAHAPAQMRALACECPDIQTNAHMRAHARMCTLASTNINTRTRTRTHTRACMQRHTRTNKHARTDTLPRPQAAPPLLNSCSVVACAGRFVQKLRMRAASRPTVTMRQGLAKRIINAEGEEWQEGQVGAVNAVLHLC